MRIDGKLEGGKSVVALGPGRGFFGQAVRVEDRPLVDGAIGDRLGCDARHGLDDVDLGVEQPTVMQAEIEHREQEPGEADYVREQNSAPEIGSDLARDPAVRDQPAGPEQRRHQRLAPVEAGSVLGHGRLRDNVRRARKRGAYRDVVAVERHPIPNDGVPFIP